ncbi:MAG: branched-chain amino acid ABC transporter ATP-binding protein [Deltaproteobacteria bacterium]|nr:MAG: branched-chain amino acid ABC transporter ATP-binding protein [Deltaproteobacteria bacterium]
MLRVEKINVSYGEFQVLHEVSIEVKSGETAIVVGPNGAGKTTLLRVISGLLKPTSGAIYFDGHRIDDKEPHEIVELGIALVPEGGRLFPYLTVYDNLKIGSFAKRARGGFRRTLEEIFELFPILKERRNQLAGSLSGGERQMLAIARSLMSQPKLIMLDEPSLGLAPRVVSRVFEFIGKIRSQGYSILMVEQNARKALELADHAYLLESGKLEFHGGREDFLRNPYIKKAYLGI